MTVQGVLRNPFYIGIYRYNYRDEAKTKGNAGHEYKSESDWIIVENHHEPIIEREQWERVSSILTNNRRIIGNGKTYNRGNVHLFSGLVRCGYCGSIMGANHDKKRSNGYKPSLYLCTRKRRFNDCPNKYISDVSLGPFAFNYIANMIKASNSFGVSTSIETLEKKLLRGKALSKVEHIEGVGLQELYDALKRSKSENKNYELPVTETSVSDKHSQELDLLLSEKRRSERALDRLQTLYLYGEDSIGEKDYVLERSRIVSEIETINKRISELDKIHKTNFSLSDDEFLEKASYFIISQQLSDKREISFETFAKNIDNRTARNFLTSIVQNFCIKNGKVESIRFKNGMEHRFLYKS